MVILLNVLFLNRYEKFPQGMRTHIFLRFYILLHIISDLEATLLLLPFDYVQKLLTLLIEYLDRFQSPELCVKCVVFLMKIHHGILTSSHQYLNLVEQLRTSCMKTIEQLRVSRNYL
jgi:hypothetical protein